MKKGRIPWTLEELQAALPAVEDSLDTAEAVCREAGFEPRPLPVLSTEECLEFFGRILDSACGSPLSPASRFLFEQLLATYRMAVLAEALGKKGRYYVFSEEDLRRHLDELGE